MKAYLAFISARARVLLQYRAAALAGVVTQFFWGIIRVMIFSAFYQWSDATPPMTLKETVTYIWLGQALLGMVAPWVVDRELDETVRSGNVAYLLTKPVDLYGLWFCRSIAMRLIPALLRGIPLFIIAGLFFGLSAPQSIASAVAFAAATCGALLISTTLSCLMTISLFWTVSGEGVNRIMPPIVVLLSGLLIPLPLFPPWAQTIIQWLPFRGMIDIPFRLYMGHLPPTHAPQLIAFQLAWVAILVLFGRGLLNKALKKLVVNGG